MEVIAVANLVRQSPLKVRVVANRVKDLPIEEALEQLEISIKKAAGLILKTLKSAIANAKHDHDLKVEDLKIKEIQVGPAPTLKRMRARARGRANVIRKRSSRIRIVLESVNGK